MTPTASLFSVWGYSRPQAPLTDRNLRDIKAAGRFAERGGDEDGGAAWALEVELPMPLSVAFRDIGPRSAGIRR